MTETLLKDSSFVVYDNAQASKKYAPYITCQVVVTGMKYFPVQLAYAIPKNSPFYGAFHYHISKLKEIGTIKRYVDSYEGLDQVCPDYSGKPLPSSQCFTAFLVMIFGVANSALWLG